MRYPAVLSEVLTVQRALDGSSLARFGDGEIKIARGRDAKSQRHDPELQRALLRVLGDWRGPAIPCIPNIGGKNSPKEAFWSDYRAEKIVRLYKADGIYGSAFVTRPDSAPKPFDAAYWRMIRRLWEGRDVVLVRGSEKSLVAADLAGAASVTEIIGPRQHAWAAHADLLGVLKGERRPVILCLGATATVLAWELAQDGTQALDLGHVGMFLRKLTRGEDPAVVTDEDRAA